MLSEPGDMAYRILVFNQKPLGSIDGEEVLEAISRSNFHTLCEQYSISPDLILPGRMSLEVVAASRGVATYFVLHYHPDRRTPLIIHEWNFADAIGGSDLEAFKGEISSHVYRKQLLCSSHLVSIELQQSQLNDLGRLLAYELARWAVEVGNGLVRGLEGEWYRLNANQAFIPIEE